MQPSRYLLFPIFTFSALAFAQVQFQFATPSTDSTSGTYAYNSAVQLTNGDRLLVGSRHASSAVGLDVLPVPHWQISLATVGSAQFQNGQPADVLPVLGGSGNDQPQAAAVDPHGNIWIVGNTDSDDFNLMNPIVSHKYPYRPAGFVIELDPTGTNLLFATYLGGQQPPPIFCSDCVYGSYAYAIAVDKSGAVYVGGTTNEADFPTTPGAYLTKGNPIGVDGFGDEFYYSFLLKISPAGQLVYSTLLGTGGSGCLSYFDPSTCIGRQSTNADVSSIAVDNNGVATVAELEFGDFSLGGAAALRLSADGSKLLSSVPVGLSYGGVTTLSLAQDSSYNVFLFGRYITAVPQIFLPPQAGTPGLFSAKLGPEGTNVIDSTDLGQSPDANAAGIVLDAAGNAYLAGTSSSPQFPNLLGVPNLGADFVMSLDSSSSKPQTLFRFPQGTIGAPPIFDNNGNLVLAGSIGSVITLPPRYKFDTPAIVGIANAASHGLASEVLPGEIMSLYGFDLAGGSQKLQVYFDRHAASVLYAGANQINIQVPFESSPTQLKVVAAGGTITVNMAGTPVLDEFLPLLPPLPALLGIFTTDGVYAAALNQDGTANSSSKPAVRGSIISLFGTGAAWPSSTPDGKIATSAHPLSPDQNPFQVVDSEGTPQEILYAGTAPGLIYGVFQLNIQLTPGAYLPLTLQSVSTGLASNAVQIHLNPPQP